MVNIALILLLSIALASASTCPNLPFNATMAISAEQPCRLIYSIWDVSPVPSSSPSEYLCYSSGTFNLTETKMCTNRTKVCNGDSNYCSRFNCSYSSYIYCQNQKLKPIRRGDCGFGWMMYDRNTTQEVCYELPQYKPPPFDNFVSSSDILFVTEVSSSIEVTIRSTSTFSYIKFLRVLQSKLGTPSRKVDIKFKDQSKKRSSEVFEVPLTPDTVQIYVMTDDVYTSVYSRSYEKSQFNLTTDDLCNTGRCEYCETKSQYAFCQVGNFGYINTMFVLVAIVISICLLPWIVACCTVLVRCTKCLIRPFCNCCNKVKDSQSVELIAHQDDADNDDTYDEVELPKPEPEVVEEAVSKLRKLKKKKTLNKKLSTRPTTVMLPLLFFFMLPLLSQAACTSNVISNSLANSCTRFNNSHSQCQITPIVTFGLTGVGDEICIDLMTNNSVSAGKINVKFISLTASSPLSTQYYTSCWYPVVESSKSCFLESCCSYGSYGSCSDWNSADINPCGKFSPGLVQIPGRTGCNSYAGCAGNGCFSCSSSCNYYRYGFMPRDEVIRVATVGNFIQYTAVLSISTSFSAAVFTVNTQNSVYADPSGNFNMVLQGLFIDFSIALNRPIAIKGGTVKFVSASLVNTPAKDTIGDIQSSVPNMLSAGVNSFRFADNMIVPNTQAYGTTFESSGCGAQFFDSSAYPALPTSQSGLTWVYKQSSDSIVADITRSLTAVSTLTFKKPFTFQFLDEAICPEISKVTATGCFSCDEGAIVTVSSRSTCFAGVCRVVVPSNYISSTNTVYLTNSMSQLNFTLFSSTASNNMSITLSCKDKSASYSASFTLVPKLRVDNATNTTTLNPPSRPSSMDLSGLDLGLGLDAEWKNQLVLALIIIACLILFFLILYFSCRFCPCNWCKQSKMDIFKDLVGINAVKAAATTNRFQYSQLTSADPDVMSSNSPFL